MKHLAAVLAILLGWGASGSPLWAQPAGQVRAVPEPPRGVAGSIVSVDGDSVVLRQQDGADQTVLMTAGWTVSTQRTASLAEVRLGDFVGSASRDIGPDRGRANELRVFEPGYRPEYGTHPIAQPDTSMTHGFVFGVRPTEGGAELDIAYPGGRRSIFVPGGMGVTMFDLKPRAAAAPGVRVSTVTRRGQDGVWRASRLVLAPQH